MNKTQQQTLFSSASEEWETPQELFDALQEYLYFTLDPCATAENAKCSRFFTKEQNGLQQNWEGNDVFMNPPYGRGIGAWVKKAYEASQSPDGQTSVTALLPARTDTKWFHEYVLPYADILFLKGRLKFGNSKNPAPFPSMVVIWTPWCTPERKGRGFFNAALGYPYYEKQYNNRKKVENSVTN